jgi:hypothetical protein
MKRTLYMAMLTIAVLAPAQRSFAEPITFTASLSGVAQSPQNASPGTGVTTVIIDAAAHTLQISVSFTGLQGNTTASHIHCLCPAPPGVEVTIAATQLPTFVGFPLDVTSGTYSNTLDTTSLSTFSPNFLAANGGTAASAEAALFAGHRSFGKKGFSTVSLGRFLDVRALQRLELLKLTLG